MFLICTCRTCVENVIVYVDVGVKSDVFFCSAIWFIVNNQWYTFWSNKRCGVNAMCIFSLWTLLWNLYFSVWCTPAGAHMYMYWLILEYIPSFAEQAYGIQQPKTYIHVLLTIVHTKVASTIIPMNITQLQTTDSYQRSGTLHLAKRNKNSFTFCTPLP